MVGVMYFIYKHSKNPLVSVIIFMGIEFFTLSFTALRQMIAVAILVNSYTFIKDKKPIKFVLTVLLASLFHKTAIVFLIVYLFNYIKINKKTMIIGGLIFLVSQIIGIELLTRIGSKIYPSYFPKSPSFTTNGIKQAAVILVYWLIGIFIYYKYVDKNKRKEYNSLSIIIFMAFFIQSFTNRIPMVNRLIWYFYIFNIIYMPNLISNIKDIKVRNIFYAGITILSLVQYILFSASMYNVVPYKFL